jgi:hypothetical protein
LDDLFLRGGSVTDLIPVETISGRIFLIRGHKVILDRDLAELYGVETRVLKQAVRRNIERSRKISCLY